MSQYRFMFSAQTRQDYWLVPLLILSGLALFF